MYKEKCLVSTVKHGGGNIAICGCLTSNVTGELHAIDRIRDAEDYIKIVKRKKFPSHKHLKRRTLLQLDNDQKHSAKTKST